MKDNNNNIGDIYLDFLDRPPEPEPDGSEHLTTLRSVDYHRAMVN